MIPLTHRSKTSRPFFKSLAVGAMVFCGALSPVLAQTDGSPAKSSPSWGTIDVGAKYVGWQSNSPLPDNGWEVLTPLTLSAVPWSGGRVYAQTEFAAGNYTDSVAGTETLTLRNFSDTVVGLEANFKNFSVPSLLNIAVNIPTGNPAWETQQSRSMIPTEFIDSDYRGRGFGMSLLYGLSLPAGGQQFGIAAGYMYTGAFNPYYGQPGFQTEQLKLGDSVFLSVNRAADQGGGQSDFIRLSAFYFLPTQEDGSNLLQMGPNLNASYGWSNPKAFSFEAGAQYFLPTEQAVNGQLVPGSNGSLGTRFYLYPSYAFGDLTVLARAKYILANDYPASNAFYDGGGFLLGLEPSLQFKLDTRSSLRFSTGYDFVLWQNGAYDSLGSRVNLEYGYWTFGTYYEVNL
jgi:hypothetical protein